MSEGPRASRGTPKPNPSGHCTRSPFLTYFLNASFCTQITRQFAAAAAANRPVQGVLGAKIIFFFFFSIITQYELSLAEQLFCWSCSRSLGGYIQLADSLMAGLLPPPSSPHQPLYPGRIKGSPSPCGLSMWSVHVVSPTGKPESFSGILGLSWE